MRTNLSCCLLFFLSLACFGQVEDCNKLGAWVWHVERTVFTSHELVANNLASLGVKRVYLKVSDGRVDTTRWDEMVDEEVVATYKKEELELWAWSYNYVGNDSLQAQALYNAAKTGYDGYVIDVEMEFDGQPLALFNLFFAFDQAKQRAIQDGHINSDFKVYCTTWGNPKDHNYSISVIDPFVDAFMPQTYVEQWGLGFITNLTYWVNAGNEEYKELGATKPIHHIIAMQDGIVTSRDVNDFFTASGAESSLWRVPGGGVPLSIWEEWLEVEWNKSFCNPTANLNPLSIDKGVTVFPNPFNDILKIKMKGDSNSTFELKIRNSLGATVYSQESDSNLLAINLSHLPVGFYFLGIGDKSYKIMKK